MAHDDAEFLEAGLKSYAEALLTLDHFSARVLERAKSYLESRATSDVFRPGERSVQRAAHVGSAAPWLAARVNGLLREQPAQLELGIWWVKPDEVVAYAGFREGPEWARRELVPDGVATRQLRGDSANYFVSPIDGSRLEDAWARVLDQLTMAVRRRPDGA